MNVLINNKELFSIPFGVEIHDGIHYSACGMCLDYQVLTDDNRESRKLPFIFYPIEKDHRRLKGLVKGKRHMEVYLLKHDILKCYPYTTQEQLYKCIGFASKFLFADPFDEKELKQEGKIYNSDYKDYSDKTSVSDLIKQDKNSKSVKKGGAILNQVHNILQWDDYNGASKTAISIAEYIKKKAGDNEIMTERLFYNKELMGRVKAGIIYPNQEVFIFDIKPSDGFDYNASKKQLNMYVSLIKKYKVIGASVICYDTDNKIYEKAIKLD